MGDKPRDWRKELRDAGVFLGCVLGFLAFVQFGLGPVIQYGWVPLKSWFEKPDDRCYWQVRSSLGTVLVDTEPAHDCAEATWANAHRAFEGEDGRAADFASKAGRRICGQVTPLCSAGHTGDQPRSAHVGSSLP